MSGLWQVHLSARYFFNVQHTIFLTFNILQGSVATWQGWWNLCWLLCCKFPRECESERTFKICQYDENIYKSTELVSPFS